MMKDSSINLWEVCDLLGEETIKTRENVRKVLAIVVEADYNDMMKTKSAGRLKS